MLFRGVHQLGPRREVAQNALRSTFPFLGCDATLPAVARMGQQAFLLVVRVVCSMLPEGSVPFRTPAGTGTARPGRSSARMQTRLRDDVVFVLEGELNVRKGIFTNRHAGRPDHHAARAVGNPEYHLPGSRCRHRPFCARRLSAAVVALEISHAILAQHVPHRCRGSEDRRAFSAGLKRRVFAGALPPD